MDKSSNNPPNTQGTLDARRKAMEEAVKRARSAQAPGQRDAYSEDEDTGGDPEHSRTIKMARVEGQAFAERAVHTMKLGRISEPTSPAPAPEEGASSLWLPLSVAIALGLTAFLIVRFLL